MLQLNYFLLLKNKKKLTGKLLIINQIKDNYAFSKYISTIYYKRINLGTFFYK